MGNKEDKHHRLVHIIHVYAFLVFGACGCSHSNLRCPPPSHWNTRALQLCSKLEKYFCLEYIDNYMEGCNGPDQNRKGTKTVFRQHFDVRGCMKKRYQPFKFTTVGNSECVYQKSLCNEEGQIIYSNRTTTDDRTCRCDHSKGYAFNVKPVNQCFCVPSAEDCSCYKKTCTNETFELSSDYKCIKQDDLHEEDGPVCDSPQQIMTDELQEKLQPSTFGMWQTGFFTFRSSKLGHQIFILVVIAIMILLFLITFFEIQIPLSLRWHKDTIEMKPILEGKTITLKVNFYAIGASKDVQWYKKQGQEWKIVNTKRHSRGLSEKRSFSLEISEIRKTDEGLYRCVVSSKLPFLSKYIEKDIYVYTGLKAKDMEHSEVEIKEHSKDKSYFRTPEVEKAIEILESGNYVLILGREGVGKTKLCLEIGKHYMAKRYSVIFLKALPSRNEEKSSLKELYILDINEKTDDVTDETFDFIDQIDSNKKIVKTISSLKADKWISASRRLTLNITGKEDKQQIIQKQISALEMKDKNDIKKKMEEYIEKNMEEIINIDSDIGFPTCSKRIFTYFTSADSTGFFPGKDFHWQTITGIFNHPSNLLVSNMESLRSGERADKVKYTTLVYILENGSLDVTKDRILAEMSNIADRFLFEIEWRISFVKDAAENLTKNDVFLKKNGNDKYMFRTEAVKRAVWISYFDVDIKYCLSKCDWSYIENIVRPSSYPAFLKILNVRYARVDSDQSYILTDRLKEHSSLGPGEAFETGRYINSLRLNGRDLMIEIWDYHFKQNTVLLSLFEGITRNGTDSLLLIRCLRNDEQLVRLDVDTFGNCLLHYLVLLDYVSFTENFISIFGQDKFLYTLNSKDLTACHLACFLGRSNIFIRLESKLRMESKLKGDKYIRTFCDLTVKGRQYAGYEDGNLAKEDNDIVCVGNRFKDELTRDDNYESSIKMKSTGSGSVISRPDEHVENEAFEKTEPGIKCVKTCIRNEHSGDESFKSRFGCEMLQYLKQHGELKLGNINDYNKIEYRVFLILKELGIKSYP